MREENRRRRALSLSLLPLLLQLEARRLGGGFAGPVTGGLGYPDQLSVPDITCCLYVT